MILIIYGTMTVRLIFSSLMVINSFTSIYAVLFLILNYVSASSILLILKCEFIALIFITIYLLAVVVLFLFVVLLLVDIKLFCQLIYYRLYITLIQNLKFIQFLLPLLFFGLLNVWESTNYTSCGWQAEPLLDFEGVSMSLSQDTLKRALQNSLIIVDQIAKLHNLDHEMAINCKRLIKFVYYLLGYHPDINDPQYLYLAPPDDWIRNLTPGNASFRRYKQTISHITYLLICILSQTAITFLKEGNENLSKDILDLNNVLFEVLRVINTGNNNMEITNYVSNTLDEQSKIPQEQRLSRETVVIDAVEHLSKINRIEHYFKYLWWKFTK